MARTRLEHRVAALLAVLGPVPALSACGDGGGPGGSAAPHATALAVRSASPWPDATPPPRTIVALEVGDVTPDGEAQLDLEEITTAVRAGITGAGFVLDTAATAGFRARVAVLYDVARVRAPAAADARAADGGAGIEVLARVDVSLIPVSGGRIGRALEESGAATASAASPGEGQLRVIRRLSADLTGILAARIWPGSATEAGLRERLASAEAAVRLGALEQVDAAGLRALAPEVAALVLDPIESVAARAVGVVGSLGDPAVIPTLIRSARRKSGPLLHRLVDVIGQIGGKQARAYLRAVADGHPDPEARARAGAALASMARRMEDRIPSVVGD